MSHPQGFVRVLSFPARHPYTSKFDSTAIRLVNPGSDLLTSDDAADPNMLARSFPPSQYDLVHMHFSLDRVSLHSLERLLRYFHVIHKPIVWTIHNRNSQRGWNIGSGKYQKLLYAMSDFIISPTEGSKNWAIHTFGPHTRTISVIPLGFMAPPEEVLSMARSIPKFPRRFVMLIGEFRQNKEVIAAIEYWLDDQDLHDTTLELIYKPPEFVTGLLKHRSVEMKRFFELAASPRITSISMPNIPHNAIISSFLRSKAVILPYRWGTHSGQIELARDCGCEVAVANVGYYREQWPSVRLWNNHGQELDRREYLEALRDVLDRPSRLPAGMIRREEWNNALRAHLRVYESALRARS